MRESKIEAAVCEYAIHLGLLVYKFTSPNRRGVPDRMFVTSEGTVFFIEFKATGEQATPQQLREHNRLRGHSIKVAVVDNVEEGKQAILMMLAKDRVADWNAT